MSAPPEPAASRRIHFRRSSTPRLAADDARRQGQITKLAFHVLGRDAAIHFLNTDNADLGARPLDLAIASDAGCASVEAALGRLAFKSTKG